MFALAAVILIGCLSDEASTAADPASATSSAAAEGTTQAQLVAASATAAAASVVATAAAVAAGPSACDLAASSLVPSASVDAATAGGGLILDSIESTLVPLPAEFAVLLTSGYDPADAPLPLMLLVHGGGDSRDFLAR